MSCSRSDLHHLLQQLHGWSLHKAPFIKALGAPTAAWVGKLNSKEQLKAKFLHCVHTADAESEILTQEHLSPV
jgi:hypothetical protein